jgi:hypothetical protein
MKRARRLLTHGWIGAKLTASGYALWGSIDDYLRANLLDEMGDGGDYADLTIQQAEIGEIYDPDQVAYPFLLVRGLSTSYVDSRNPHAGGTLHYDGIGYPYEVITICRAATAATATANAKELARRVREFIRTRPALGGLAATDTERVDFVRLRDVVVQIRGHGGQNGAGYVGTSFTRLIIYSGV